MTMPDAASPRKPAARRRWLFAPYIALILVFVGWSVFWLVLSRQIETRLDRQASDLRAAGYQAAWKTAKIGGYPFRIEVELTAPRLREPSGWGLAAPRLTAMANAYDLTHWVLVAPEGLTLSRPAASDVAITGSALRASLADLDRAPRIVFEGEGLGFVSADAADPFPISAADRIDMRLQTGGDDQARIELSLKGAQTQRVGLFAQIAPLAPMSATLIADLSKRSALTGRDWAGSVQAWTAHGGAATVDQLLVSIGDVSLSARGGPLSVGADGHLTGGLDLSLRQGAAALAQLGAAQGVTPPASGAPELRLTLADGQTRLGPIRIGPAPRVY